MRSARRWDSGRLGGLKRAGVSHQPKTRKSDTMLIQETRPNCKRRRAPVHNSPKWIIFRAGSSSARVPFREKGETSAIAWLNILGLTSLGFHAHRENDAIIVTGSPTEEGGCGHA